MGIAAITLSTSLVTLINATLLGIMLIRKINLNYSIYFKNLFKMLAAAVIDFSLNYLLYNIWTVDSWFLLLIRTVTVFALCMTTYIIFALIFRIEYVGELIERIREYIKRKIGYKKD